MVLIRSRASLISAGTERMLLEFGRANWIDKARQQPDKIRLVLDKVRTDGFVATMESVRAKLDQPIPLGYSNAGVVLETGPGVEDLKPGDRVVSNGNHAELVQVSKNLCAKIPAGVSDEAAAFTVVGAIALQGIRLIQPALGEMFAVTGLGLLGLITVQLLKAHGCRVLGIDFDARKLDLARSFGIETVDLARGEDPVAAAQFFTQNHGVDGVLITAATKSNEPMHQAALMCRKRGRIVLVGTTGLELSRDDFYKKELSFQVSCSYGPGRYDPSYESGSHDYPYAYVRWTEQRNFQAVLNMLSEGQLDVTRLVTHRFPFGSAQEAYGLIESNQPYLGIVLDYPDDTPESELKRRTIPLATAPAAGEVRAAMLGAGQFASKVLIPALKSAHAELAAVVSAGGITASHYGRKYRAANVSTDAEVAFAEPSINAVFVATRNDTHAEYVCRALRAGKHVYVEKPLALTAEEIDRIESTYEMLAVKPVFMVGFNRRFAPHIERMKSALDGINEPKAFIYTINAGVLPSEHWTLDPSIGGGRIAGEACHFIDLLRFLAGSPIVSLTTTKLGHSADQATLSIRFANDSIGTVHYLGNGHRSFPKERLEVFCGGRVIQLDNFVSLKSFGWPGVKSKKLWRQDKGNTQAVQAFVDAIKEGAPSPIAFHELVEVARYTLEAALS